MKEIKWDNLKTGMLEKTTHGNVGDSGTMRKALVDAYVREEKEEASKEIFAEIMPLVKSLMIVRMAERTPIKLSKAFTYYVEELNTAEDDGFYNIKKSDAQFVTKPKILSPGTELTFINIEKSLNQMWFKTNKNEEIGIYLDQREEFLKSTDMFDLIYNLYLKGEI